MKNIVSTFVLLVILPLNVFSQETRQAGIVTFQNSKDKPVVGVQIKALWANPQLSTTFGKFELIFIGKPPGTEVDMTIDYAGYEVVNKKELTYNLNPDKQIKFYLCKLGEWENNALSYYTINKEKIIKEYDEKYKRLVAKNSHLLDSLTILERQKNDALNSVKELSELFAKINLDDVSDLFNDAFFFFKKGDIDNAIKILDAAKLSARLDEAVKKQNEGVQLIEIGKEKKQNAETAIKDYVKLCKSTAQLCIAGYKFKEAKKYFELAIKYDSTNADYVLKYTKYLYNLNDTFYLNYSKQAINLLNKKYESLAKSTPFTDSSYTLLFLFTNQLSNALNLLDNWMMSKEVMIRTFNLFNQTFHPSDFSFQLRAKICASIVAINFKNEDFYGKTLNYSNRDSLHLESKTYLNIGWKIIDSLSKIDSVKYLSTKKYLLTMASLFNVYSGKREKGLQLLLSSIELEKKVFESEKDTSEYLQNLVADYSRLDMSYRALNKIDSALYARRTQTSYAKQLVTLDSTYYYEDYLASLAGTPPLFDELKQFDSSNYYRHFVLKEYEKLSKTNPYKYLANIADKYSDLAEWWVDRSNQDSALKYYKITCYKFDTLSTLAPKKYLKSYSRALADYGYRLFKKKNYKLAEVSLKKALNGINEVIINYDPSIYSYRNRFIISNNIGDLNFEIEKYDTALFYYLNVLKDILSMPEKDTSIWNSPILQQYSKITEAYFNRAFQKTDTLEKITSYKEFVNNHLDAYNIDSNVNRIFQCAIAYYNMVIMVRPDAAKEYYWKKIIDFFEIGIRKKPEKMDAVKKYFCDINEDLSNFYFKRCAWDPLLDYSTKAINVCSTPKIKALNTIAMALNSSNINEYISQQTSLTAEIKSSIKESILFILNQNCISELDKNKLNLYLARL